MKLVRTLGRLATRPGCRSYHHEGHSAPATLNDLPQPQGSWKTQYDANQRKYNAHLLIGVGALVGTVVFGKAAGLLEFYNDIPDQPADIQSYK